MGSTDVNYCSPSYPKTGNTWVRVLLGRYCQLLYGLSYLPLMEGTDEEAAAIGRRIAFHHGPLTWEAQTADDLDDQNVCSRYLEQSRIILIIRHPLDCLLSLFMQTKHREGYRIAHATSSFSEFLRSPVFGIDKFVKFHNLWARHIPSLQIHLLRYEDFRQNTHKGANKLAAFLDLPLEEGLLSEAVAYASFENMRQLESKHSLTYRTSGLNIFGSGDPTNPDALHVRAGRIGGYMDYLSPEELDVHLARLTTLDPVFGYSHGDHRRSS